MKRKFGEVHSEYIKYKKDEKELKLIYDTVKKDYMENRKLNITLEKIYLKNKLEDYKGHTIDTYIDILIVIITTILTILLENSISEASNYVVGIISVVIVAPLIFWGLLKIERRSIRKEIDKHIYYNVCLDVIEEIEREKER